MNLKVCKNCKIKHNGEYGSGIFCSSKCARSYSTKFDNKKETKNAKCTTCDSPIKINKRSNPKIVRCTSCFEKNPRKKYTNTCEICGDIFEAVSQHAKSCSKTCTNYILSIKRSKYLLENGTSNFKTKREKFTYKFIKDIECDSKLEQAAIIYLVDTFKADKIYRFKSILNFWENNIIHKTFNPDFYVKKNNDIFIVEVKMVWQSNIDHPYNNNIPLKKKALKSFCDSKGYEMIWLDFNYDKKFMSLYRKMIRSG